MKLHIITAVLIVFNIASFAFAEDLRGLAEAKEDQPVNENPVTVQVRMEPKDIPVGGQSKLMIDMTVASGHHAYVDMIKVKWVSEEGATLEGMTIKPTMQYKDPFSKKDRESVEDQATLTSTLKIPNALQKGSHTGKVQFSYQACSARYCLFPKTVTLDVPLNVVDANVAPTTETSTATGIQGDFQRALSKGKFWAFLFAFIGGFLTSLTPCVFPMIPITISIIGARSVSQQRSRSFALSVSYVLGIAFTYSLLGVVAASTGAFFGSALSNIYVVSTIAVVFVLMGLSMLGFYELQVPAVIRNKFGNASTGTGLPGAFVAGLFAGVVASPCIGPVLVAILTYVAQTAQAVFGFFLLFTFAMGMGILFIVLGTFSGLLSKIPRAGGWMNATKFIFGFTFIGMAFFYLAPIVSDQVFTGLIAIGLFFGASYYGAFMPSPQTAKEQLRKGFCLALFSLAVCLTAKAVLYDQLKVVSSGTMAAEKVAPSKGLVWENYSKELFDKSIADKKPVIIDFFAEWCVACHELESFTYTDSQVMELGQKFTLLKIDATNPTPLAEEMKKRFKVVGLPTVIFVDANGVVREDLTTTGFEKAPVFLNKMKVASQMSQKQTSIRTPSSP